MPQTAGKGDNNNNGCPSSYIDSPNHMVIAGPKGPNYASPCWECYIDLFQNRLPTAALCSSYAFPDGTKSAMARLDPG